MTMWRSKRGQEVDEDQAAKYVAFFLHHSQLLHLKHPAATAASTPCFSGIYNGVALCQEILRLWNLLRCPNNAAQVQRQHAAPLGAWPSYRHLA